MLGLKQVASDVSEVARANGCERPNLPGLCVQCPLKTSCEVPRVPLMLWTTRLTLDLGNAEPIFYLSELTTSPMLPKARRLPRTGVKTNRQGAVEVRCGDLFTSIDVVQGDGKPHTVDLGVAVNLPTYIHEENGFEYAPCEEHVILDAYQLRHMQVSNYGRQAIVAVQACSKRCAERNAHLVQQNWRLILSLLRKVRS